MAQGLQVFDAAGNIIFDTSDRVGRVLGLIRINAGDTGSFTPTGFTNGQVFASFQRDQTWITGNTSQFVGALPVISISGNTIFWTSNSQYISPLGNTITVQTIGGWLTYGVY